MVARRSWPISGAIKAAMRGPDNTDAEAKDAIVSATEALLSAVEPFLSYCVRRHLTGGGVPGAASAERDISHESGLAVGSPTW